jgi:hypothetical protein
MTFLSRTKFANAYIEKRKSPAQSKLGGGFSLVVSADADIEPVDQIGGPDHQAQCAKRPEIPEDRGPEDHLAACDAQVGLGLEAQA